MVICLFVVFAGWGLIGNLASKAPALDDEDPSPAAVPRLTKLKNAIGIRSAKKGDKEQNVLLNDPFISEKWGLVRTKTQQAWEITKGSKDIIVAVIDTGVDIRHKDLTGNLWVNKGETGIDPKTKKDRATDKIDNDDNGCVDDVHGCNFITMNGDLTDNHGHGTHIEGIIGAQGGNGFGISGVAPKVTLMTLKYYDPKVPGANNLRNTIKAIHYAVKMGAKIINYSGGGTEFSKEEFEAVKSAETKGILFIAAAGNERSNTDEKGKHYYPADYDLSNIISVTAVNEKETKVLPSSNYGVNTVDLAAPGDQINSTLPGDTFGKMTGTSQATAFATGVAVLVMAHRPEFAAAEVKKYLLRTGDEYPTLLSKTGNAKLLNSYKALTMLDKGISINGQATVNTENHAPFTVSPDGDSKRRTGPSALSGGAETVDPAEEMSSFSRDLIRALNIGGSRASGRGPSRSSDGDSEAKAHPAGDPQLDPAQ